MGSDSRWQELSGRAEAEEVSSPGGAWPLSYGQEQVLRHEGRHDVIPTRSRREDQRQEKAFLFPLLFRQAK